MRVAARCIHHDPKPGQIQVCAIGIPMRDVFRRGVGPCLRLEGRPDHSAACARFEPVSQETLDAEHRETKALLAAFDAGLCPMCQAALTLEETEDVIIWRCPEHGGVARGCKSIDGVS